VTQGVNPFLLNLERKLTEEYNQIFSQEEIHWYQKSRCQRIAFETRILPTFTLKLIDGTVSVMLLHTFY
jgi:hypothetical protein